MGPRAIEIESHALFTNTDSHLIICIKTDSHLFNYARFKFINYEKVKTMILLLISGFAAWSQTNTFPSSGSAGVGTTNPDSKFVIANIGGSDNTKMLGFGEGEGSGAWFESGFSPNGDQNFVKSNTTGVNMMMWKFNGNVGIETTNPKSKLAMEGQIRATEVKVLADISVPDYVFEPNYELRTLKETKEYITENKHLPEIPSATEIGDNGIELGDRNMRLLKKIEELTLYQIERLEKLEEQQERIAQLEKKVK